jgi:hypothetical protein
MPGQIVQNVAIENVRLKWQDRPKHDEGEEK